MPRKSVFNYNPNPPKIGLFVSNVTDFYFGKEEIPYEKKMDESNPQCAFMPDYYFHKKEGNCISCKTINPTKCKLKYLSNFWFKIDSIKEIENVEEEFINLVNCFTKDTINFAIPILYPLLITQRNERTYFRDLINLISHKEGYKFEIKSGEKGHSKTDKTKRFFDKLNEHCRNCFSRVESTPYFNPPNRYELQRSNKNDEIFIFLPSEYRRDGSPSRYAIYLDAKTTGEQKQRVEELIYQFIKKM